MQEFDELDYKIPQVNIQPSEGEYSLQSEFKSSKDDELQNIHPKIEAFDKADSKKKKIPLGETIWVFPKIRRLVKAYGNNSATRSIYKTTRADPILLKEFET